MSRCDTCGGDLLRCTHAQNTPFGYADIRKGDTIRVVRNGLKIEGLAYTQGRGCWQNVEGATFVYDTDISIELVDRPKLQEPMKIAAIVWAGRKDGRGRCNWTRINKGPSDPAKPAWFSQRGEMARWDELDADYIRFEGTVLQ